MAKKQKRKKAEQSRLRTTSFLGHFIQFTSAQGYGYGSGSSYRSYGGYGYSGGRLRIRWGNVLLLLLFLAVFAWISFFSAAYFHLKYNRNYTEVPYFKTLISPFVWDEFSRERGNFYIKRAFEKDANGEILEALNFFRNGLTRNPSNLPARQKLASYYELVFQRPLLAINLLQDGVKYTVDEAEEIQNGYINYLVALAYRNRYYDRVIEAVTFFHQSVRALDSEVINDQILAYHVALSYRNKGQVGLARAVIQSYGLNRAAFGMVLTAQLMWDDGQEAEALELLQDKLSFYNEKLPIFLKLIELTREKGQTEKQHEFCRLFHISMPDNFNSYLSYLDYLYRHEPSNQEKIDELNEEFIAKFSKSPMAFRNIAVLLSKAGDTESLKQLLAAYDGEEQLFRENLEAFMIIESQLRSGEYAETLEAVNQMQEENGASFSLDDVSLVHSLRLAAYYGLDEQTSMRNELNILLESPYFSLDRYLLLSEFFMEVGAPELSLVVLNTCMEKRNATRVDVTQSFVEIHLKTNNLTELSKTVEDAISEGRLPNYILKDSYLKLASDKNLFVEDRGKVLQKIESQFPGDYLFRKSDSI